MISDWLERVDGITAPLFETTELRPTVFERGGKKKLRRHPAFDEAMIQLVETGLTRDDWRGLIYVMHFGTGAGIVPLYIGKAERRGVSQPISFNIANIRRNQHAFGRWGYGLAYHIGDLSHAIFREQEAYKPVSPKYERWASAVFASLKPLQLRDEVFVTLVSWHDNMRGPSGLVGSAPAVEKELIALCGGATNCALLNVDGR